MRTYIVVSLVTLGVSICSGIAPTTGPASAPPPAATTRPINLPGLHNVVQFANGLYSGAVPEGDEGFAALKQMGIKTIITVDGAAPDLERAKKFGLRYVHLPIGYNGMEKERTLEIARAVKELPKPIYIHCHHGKHRSAGATGAAAVTLGLLNPEEALARMKVSGTAPVYPGLFKCVNVATLATEEELASASNTFPEISKISDLAEAMVAIDEVYDNLKALEKAGWAAPANHPDLVPAAEAGKLADLYRNAKVADRKRKDMSDLRDWVSRSSASATDLESAIVKNVPKQELSAKLKAIGQSCTDCHVKYRN